jgi:abhydrolase domain-containing protein 6
MRNVLLGLGLLPAILTLYLAAPRALFNLARRQLRRRAGLVQRRVSAGGMSWPFLEGGNPAGRPLVLVHGFGGDKDNWLFYAPHLGKDYRLILPDLPGFGEGERSFDHDHSFAAQALRLRDFLDALQIDRCMLGGNSMGGAIALRFALDHPERVICLTLLNNAGVLGSEQSELQQQILRGERPLVARVPADFDRLLAFATHRPRFIPRRFKRLLFDDMKRHEKLLDKIFDQVSADALQRPLNHRLGEVSVPTQIIWGRHDRLVDVSCAVVQHLSIPRSELVILEDAGHVPMVEKPGETARHHLAFLARHRNTHEETKA